MTAEDIREMSFQNVLDNILKPAGVHVGGYPEDIFTDLDEEDRDKWNCNICFLVVRDARECANKHLFCHTCVFAWSLTYGENSQKCPMCRVEQRTYLPNKEVNKQIGDKRVKCPEADCTFSSPLRIFLMHSHGRERYVNDEVDLESLRPARPSVGGNLIILPGGVAFSGDLQGMLAGGAQRAANIREQLQQGRAMIHQMMMLLHLEMQLRQQALVSYSQAQDPNTRLRRLDEVLALNEQLNEVGTILSALLSTPLANRAGRTGAGPTPPTGPRRPEVSRDVMLSRGAASSIGMPGLESITSRGGSRATATTMSLNTTHDDDDDDEDSDDSDSDATSVSSVVSVAPRVRMSLTGTLHSPRSGPLATSTSQRPDLQRPARRNEIRAQLLNPGGSTEGASSSLERLTPRLLSRRETQTNSQTRSNMAATASISTAQDVANNNSSSSVSVSIQRLQSHNGNSGLSSSVPRETQGGSTSLPPLPGVSSYSQTRQSNNSTRAQISPRNNTQNSSITRGLLLDETAESSGIQTSPRSNSLLPTGSSAHQRILRSLSGTEDNNENSGDDESAAPAEGTTGASSRPNSVVRNRPYIPIGDLLRGPRVTSEGVTPSGATYSTTADTPLTRAAARGHQGASASGATVALEGVTPSGAMFTTQVDTPSSRAASRIDTGRRRSDTTANSALTNANATSSSSQDPFDPPVESSSNDVTQNTANTDTSPTRPTGRQPISRYAPQRRFRRNSSVVSNGSSDGTGGPSGTSTSGSANINVPYVPHRSSSPGRLQPTRRRTGRSNSLSVDDRHRASFTRTNDDGESVVRRAARGSNNRSSLPTTPGQLLRARRGSQSQTRRSGNNRPIGPGDTI